MLKVRLRQVLAPTQPRAAPHMCKSAAHLREYLVDAIDVTRAVR